MANYIIRNAQLADGTITDIEITDAHISAIGSNLTSKATEIDGKGLVAISGLVDLHTHLREPGFEASETIYTGSRAAAKGGFTAVHAMANTNPVADNAAVVEQVFALGKAAGYVQVQPIGAITVNLEGKQLSDMGKMNQSTANVKVFSDDGKCVSDSLVMRRALEYVKAFDGVVAQHAQDPALTVGAQMNAGALAQRLGLTGWPTFAETAIIARDVLLAEEVDSKLHVCHVSTKDSVDIIRFAKSRGIKVTAEVTPHHLLLTEDLAENYNPLYKVNPPLRTEADVLALREAVADGTIDIVATDHAPHTSDSKDCEWAEAAFGMLGLETAAAIVNTTLVTTKLISWARFQEILSLKPAEIGGLTDQGQEIKVGNYANLVLIDPNKLVKIESVSESKSSNNPYAGMQLTGSIEHTFYKGKQTLANGIVVELGAN